MKNVKVELDITKEELYDLYIIQNLSREEMCEYLHISIRVLKRILKENDIKKPKELMNANREKTCLKLFGCKNAMSNPIIAAKSKRNQRPCTKERRPSIATQIKKGLIPNRQELYQAYVIENIPKKEMCKRFNINESKMTTILHYYGIRKPTRQRGERLTKYYKEERAKCLPLVLEILNNAHSSMSVKEISEISGISQIKLYRMLRENNLMHRIRHLSGTSVMEQEFGDYLDSLSVSLEKRNRTILDNNFELDFVDFSRKIAIEFNGNFWHSDEQKEKDYHYKKSVECENKGFSLIHIYEFEWAEKKEEIKNFLFYIFNKELLKKYSYNIKIENENKVVSYDENDNLAEFVEYHIINNVCYLSNWKIEYDKKYLSVLDKIIYYLSSSFNIKEFKILLNFNRNVLWVFEMFSFTIINIDYTHEKIITPEGYKYTIYGSGDKIVSLIFK